MSGSHVLVELVVVLGTAAVITVVFQALKIPVVLGYVLAGLVIGPNLEVPLVADPKLVHVLSELGVILLMFTIGLELSLAKIRRVGAPAGLTALFEVGLAIVAGTLVATALGFGSLEAFFVGACLGISSTMLVAKAFEELGWKGGFTEVTFAILVFEDLIAVVLFAVLGGVASGSGLDGAELVNLVARLGGFLLLMLAGGLLVVPRAMRWIGQRSRPETVTVVALALCFGGSVLAEHAGYSVALGAFIAGVLVSESGQHEHVFELVKPFRDVFAMVFFVSIGMSIQPAELASELPVILLFSAVVALIKPVAITVGVFLSGRGLRPAVRAGVSLSQIGEMSFVIATIGVSSGVARPSLLAIAVGVSCVTTVSSGALIRYSEQVASWVAHRLPRRLAMFVSFYEAWLEKLDAKKATPWTRLKKPIFVLVVDSGVLIAILIASATVAPRGAAELGLTGVPATVAILAVTAVLAVPFVVSMIRRVVVIAELLAFAMIPLGHEVDLGRAPRRVLLRVLELGLGLVVSVPIVALTQPFVKGGPVVIVGIAVGLAFVVRRSLRDFAGHVSAGSELILELLASAQGQATPHPELHHVENVLPGFGGVASITLDPRSPAIGRSLAMLDLRAKTGATVLAIARGEHGMATPSATEPLQAGDVLAMAGSDEAITAARALFEPTQDG